MKSSITQNLDPDEQKVNGAALPGPTIYFFSEEELAFFKPRVEQVNSLIGMLNESTSLVCAQHKFKGMWRINAAMNGIERIDLPAPPPALPTA
jgi:hypothetical protein